ncbi:urease accessory protein UreE [Algicella marina]|uniref:Urease accessory protein UreE n=1 Tax=Algicella marina TaxID=2683284 RepID=A0A6P1T4Y3_9RHOB|nr:urease accessory protein UreE [Algicella marina]QHQ36831.1 urease accessory protein UreE [Algicella marina]
MLKAQNVVNAPAPADATVTLAYDDRFRRRMAMQTDQGTPFLLDLPEARELRAGEALELEDGTCITIRAAPEDLMRAEAQDPNHLVRTAWHVGNRHLACEIHPGHLILRWDHVIAEMLEGLGCSVSRIEAPFQPEGGAYGHGRTHGHSHDHGHHHHSHA